jgi:hypothetical protein
MYLCGLRGLWRPEARKPIRSLVLRERQATTEEPADAGIAGPTYWYERR